MTELQARQKGLTFTGCYGRDKSIIEERLAKEKLEKPLAKIVIVKIPTNKLSIGYRAGDCGWSLYADIKYYAYKTLERLANIDENFAKNCDELQKKYMADLKTLCDKHNEESVELKNAKEILENKIPSQVNE